MKLGELRAAIRKTKETPYVNIYPFPGTDKGMRFALQKTPLLAELERVYPGGKAVETGLDFNIDTGKLCCPTYEEYVGASTEEKAVAFEGSTVQGAADDDDCLLDLSGDSSTTEENDLDDLLV